jgi:PEP-CTERM motif
VKLKYLAALPLVGALTFSAHAEASTTNWSFGGDGNVSASGTLTFGFNPNASSSFGSAVTPVPPPVGGYPPVTTYTSAADPLSSSLITGASGVFSDVALGLSNVAITGVLTDNFLPHFAPDPTIPQSFSYLQNPNPSDWVSYDNLFYVNGSSPQTCSLPGLPPALPPGNYGGYFDNYGVMFTLANGDYVDLYSNGDIQATQAGAEPVTLPPYGVVVITSAGPDYTSAQSLAFATPEPATWAMFGLGFLGLGLVGLKRQGRRAEAAAA